MIVLDIFLGLMAELFYCVTFCLKTKQILLIKILAVVGFPLLGGLATVAALLLLGGLGMALDWMRYDLPKRWRSKRR